MPLVLYHGRDFIIIFIIRGKSVKKTNLFIASSYFSNGYASRFEMLPQATNSNEPSPSESLQIRNIK